MKFNACLIALICLLSLGLNAQEDSDMTYEASSFSGMKLRNVGPAFTSGRIADIAIHPNDDNVWYVAVGSGGVWKTENAGTTWQPIFDDQPSYSIGCVTIDPNNPHTIWVGTGENVGGRHVGFGDGIYRSTDDGKTWKNMGLKKSEHISKIIVHPENSDVLWVAAQGPLWSKGDERGLYKSTDGGETWKKVLGDAEWTGVTDILIDPRDPDVLYAATWQRHRTVAAYMGGGPKTGIHRSMDGGETWEELKTGLPSGNKGKIGLAISPQKPDVIYAAIELNRTKGGVYRSENRGASWTKMSDAVSGATGPHYYQELYACPHNFDRLYLVDVRIQISDDGGKNFRRLTEQDKHSDNHAIAFRKDDPDYLLIGTDGGIYESFDGAKNWRFFDNLPITQYYKVAVDDAEPFYNIFGGTQDNGSHGGPSRTDAEGIRNKHWYKTLGADGHQSATEPGNPNIIYAETQQGGLHRVDMITGEQVYIQPQPAEGEDYERFNWDAPILVSPHDPTRLYFASHRVWRSDNRGDDWTAISGDLTRDEERITLPIMGKTWSWDAPWDVNAMSNYNTITSLAESPKQEGVIYAGTDDGIVQVTEDGGQNWRKIEVGSMPGVPKTAFVNDIKADLYDANTVYVALDNHKYGDFKPYLLKSTDRGRTWKSITGNMPDRHLVWRMVQDHVAPNLLFAATEFGIYFTLDGGEEWTKVKGSPTIPFRDIVIQKRENDLVGASFGRSFFVLDDYSFLREVTEEKMKAEANLFTSIRKAYWYSERDLVGSQGASRYEADNPPFGAVFTYHLAEGYSSLEADRKETEKELIKADKDVPFPGWDALEKERRQDKPKVWLTVKDEDGNVIRRISGSTKKGLHRVAWDLRMMSKNTIRLEQASSGGWRSRGLMAVPGNYTVTLSKEIDGKITPLSDPVPFQVVPLRKGALDGKSHQEIAAFVEELGEMQSMMSAANMVFDHCMDKVKAMKVALDRSNKENLTLNTQLYELKQKLMDLDEQVSGNRSKAEIGEKTNPTVQSRYYVAYRGAFTTYGPTDMHKKSLAIAQSQFKEIKSEIDQISKVDIPKMEEALKAIGAPMIESAVMPKY